MKVAILVNFEEANPGYSLTGIVKDQVEMLTRHGHEVILFVSDSFKQKEGHLVFENMRKEVPFRVAIADCKLLDYESKKDLSDMTKTHIMKLKEFMVEKLQDFDIIFTHDWIFTGWNLPYALAVQEVSFEATLRKPRWLHWIHSIPTQNYDWWDVRRYGPKHRIVFPNSTERIRVAEAFMGDLKYVINIPHIKDLRTFWDFHQDTRELIDFFPSIMHADVSQIYPASTDRLEAKRLDVVIKIFAKIKAMGFKVSLICANQWATTKKRKEDIEYYYKMASRNGLKRNEDFLMTSDYKPEKFGKGLPQRVLRELMLLGNLFLFPTREESFGLVAPESALSGGKLMVLNKSLQSSFEVNGYSGLYVDFGSYNNAMEVLDENSYFDDIAYIIVNRIRENEALMSANFYRQHYNMDTIYHRYYRPAMGASKLWN